MKATILNIKMSVVPIIVISLFTGVSANESVNRIARYESHESDGGLELRGSGTIKKFFFKVLEGSLYLPPGISREQVLTNVPKRLEFTYHVDISGRQFAEAAEKILGHNVRPEKLNEIAADINHMHSLYRDVRKGDKYQLTYVPGTGTELRLNGEILGIVPGDDFAAEYFKIWLGSDPMDKSFKESLLKSEDSEKDT